MLWNHRVAAVFVLLGIIAPGIAASAQPPPSDNGYQLAWGTVADSWRLSVTPNSTEYVVGQPISLQCVLQNLDSVERNFAEASFDDQLGYTLDVINPRAEKVPATPPNPNIRLRGSIVGMRVLPGAAKTSYLTDIADHYVMNVPGKYALVAHRQVPSKSGDRMIDVVSNPVSITLAEPPAAAVRPSSAQSDGPYAQNQGAWGRDAGGWRTSLSADKGEWSIGEPISITLVTLNVDSADGLLFDARAAFTFDITNSIGNKCPQTPRGEIQANNTTTGGVPSMSPGEIDVRTFTELNRKYDMTLPGKYVIVVHRKAGTAPNPFANIDVASNPITITLRETTPASATRPSN
ncbi:MAG: hypothetical protein ABSH22_15455 [Tepidisphaeraceae bacterium]|jgi:hypothetical protein